MQPSWRRRFLTWQVNRANRLILVVRFQILTHKFLLITGAIIFIITGICAGLGVVKLVWPELFAQQ
jgi:hypothetical protein